jgi:hypothetical protein
MSIFNIFRKKPSREIIVLAQLVNELLNVLRDDKITKEEKEELRARAYNILLDLKLDKIIQ